MIEIKLYISCLDFLINELCSYIKFKIKYKKPEAYILHVNPGH